MSDVRVALVTSLRDQLVAPLRRSLDEVEKEFQKVQAELDKTNQKSKQTSDGLANMKGPKGALGEMEKMSRETERATALAKRFEQAWNTAGNVVKGVGASMAAFQAAKMVAAPTLNQARGYDYQLASAANTAFAGQSMEARKAGMGQLDAAVIAAVRAGGGTRDDALTGLNTLISSGTVGADTAMRMLPQIQRTATAGGASTEQISSIVVRALQNGFQEADISLMLDKALAAGQAGGFELRDMAKWLPQILASAGQLGMKGPRDLDTILAATQASVITAGSKDEAGNNMVNLLGKINSQDTQRDAQKLGIDLSGTLAAARAKGIDGLTAFTNLTSQIASKDSRFVAAQKAAAGATNDADRKAAFEAQASILQGSAIGKIVQDRQALMALVALLNNAKYMDNVKAQTANAAGTTDANLALLKDTNQFKRDQQQQEQLIAQSSGLAGANNAIGKFDETLTALYRKYPELAGYFELIKTASIALGAAAAGAAGALVLLGGGSAAKTAASTAGSALIGGAAGAAGGLITGAKATFAMAAGAPLSAMPLAYTAAGIGAAGLAGYGAGTALYHGAISGSSFGDQIGKLATQVMAGLGSADAKEALAKMAEYESKRAADSSSSMNELKAIASRPVIVQLDGRTIATSVSEREQWLARRS